MNGRNEAEEKIENYILKYLEDCPNVLKDYYYSMANRSFNTKKTYIVILNDFLSSTGNKKLKNITEEDVNKYIYQKNYSKSRMSTSFYAISSFFKWAKKKKLVRENICEGIELPRYKVENNVVYLDEKETKSLYEKIEENNKCMSTRDKAIIRLALHTGLRVSAITYINMEDIDMDNNLIRVTEKEDYTRDIYIDDKTKYYLDEWIYQRTELMYGIENQTNALFISRNKTRITTQSISNMLTKYTKDITDKHITPHKLRKTFGMNVYETTGDIFITSKLLGHASLETTKIYVEATDDRKRSAIEAIANK